MPPDPTQFVQFQSVPIEVIVTSPLFLAFKFFCVTLSVFFVMHSIHIILQTRLVKKEQMARRKGMPSGEGASIPVPHTEFQTAWNGIRARMDMRREADWKFSIIEADKLFDEALKTAGFKGKDMGERLKQIEPGELSGIDDVWQAHKVRNLLSHDVAYHINFTEAQWVIDTYEEAFKEMKLLE